MMRGIRRLVTYAAVAGLLTAGAVGASLDIAHADTEVTSCDGVQGVTATATAYKCTVATGTATAISDPSDITVSVSDDTSGYTEAVNITWTVSCTDSTGASQQQGATDNAPTPAAVPLLPLPVTADGTCSVSATISSQSASSTCPAISASSAPRPSPSPTASVCPDDFLAILSYTSAASATPTPTASSTSSAAGSPVHPVKGYDGKCLDDNGNSSANRAKIQIWNCSGTDQAENWTFSNGEFKHNGKCMNDQGNGGSRSHVILWSCNGASNEKWSELANGELKLQSHGGTLCLDDPRSSTTNGTQLIVYTCKDSANQKWSLP